MAGQLVIILYVEDEETDRYFMESAFAKAGFAGSLRMVADGREAIRYLEGSGDYADRTTHPVPDLVLLDLNLPVLHGFEVLRWIRTQPGLVHLPVVIFSSSERHEDQRLAGILGANAFEKKPGSGLDFIDVVRSVHNRWLVTRNPPPSAYPGGLSPQGCPGISE